MDISFFYIFLVFVVFLFLWAIVFYNIKKFEEYRERVFKGSGYLSKNRVLFERSMEFIKNILSSISPFFVLGQKTAGMVNYVMKESFTRYYYPKFLDLRDELGKNYYCKDAPSENVFVVFKLLEDMSFPYTKAAPYNSIVSSKFNGQVNRSDEALLENYFTVSILYFVKERILSIKETKSSFMGIHRVNTTLYLDNRATPQYASELFSFIKKASKKNNQHSTVNEITLKELARHIRRNHREYKQIIASISKNSAKLLDEKGYRYIDEKDLVTDDENLKRSNRAAGFAYTEKGFELRNHLVGFYNYLHDLAIIGGEITTDVDLWDEIMLYAAAMGLTDRVTSQLDEAFPKYSILSIYTGRNKTKITTYSYISQSIRESLE